MWVTHELWERRERGEKRVGRGSDGRLRRGVVDFGMGGVGEEVSRGFGFSLDGLLGISSCGESFYPFL